jgi:hypothetical protein
LPGGEVPIYIQSAYRKILTQNKGHETEKPYQKAEKRALK